ncbi:MAG: hypothetical protein AAFV19_04435 [Pseudomonadota bacterium]
MRALLISLFLVAPALADERAVFYGTWGSPEQCRGAPIIEGGTARAAPFEIGPDWLSHGETWCRLNWFPIEARASGFFTGAFAQCGEDTIRSYMLAMDLSDGDLQLRWDFFTSNGPLARCPGSPEQREPYPPVLD